MLPRHCWCESDTSKPFTLWILSDKFLCTFSQAQKDWAFLARLQSQESLHCIALWWEQLGTHASHLGLCAWGKVGDAKVQRRE